ncbi:MAG: phosphoesterase [Desulfobulbus propionicus]|nr:MAG: phosphoesterase [Desulfobulbus propionicus]
MKVPVKVVEAVQKAERIVLATHINPDGDAVGSLLGLMRALIKMNKQVFAFMEEPVPAIYRFMPGSARVQTNLDEMQAFVAGSPGNCLGISLDCGDRKRLGRYSEALLDIHPFVNIDHHQKNGNFGDINWVEPGRSSTGEMVFDLLEVMGAEISEKTAQCLYAAIVTDTGSFKYESTRGHTLNVACKLLRLGVRPEKIASDIYDNWSLGRLQLLQTVLATLEIYSKERIAVIRVTQSMLERTFTTMDDTEEFINLPRSVRSVKVAVFLKEVDTNFISVSLRAKGECDVASIAAGFGGGGHRNASGFRSRGFSLDEIRDRIVARITKVLDQSNYSHGM